MSGGSYNYLEHQQLVPQCWHELREMLARLEGMRDRHPLAYARTHRIVSMITTAALEAEGLRPVWHAVEWRDSRDWGDDDMHEAIDAWHAEIDPHPSELKVWEGDQA